MKGDNSKQSFERVGQQLKFKANDVVMVAAENYTPWPGKVKKVYPKSRIYLVRLFNIKKIAYMTSQRVEPFIQDPPRELLDKVPYHLRQVLETAFIYAKKYNHKKIQKAQSAQKIKLEVSKRRMWKINEIIQERSKSPKKRNEMLRFDFRPGLNEILLQLSHSNSLLMNMQQKKALATNIYRKLYHYEHHHSKLKVKGRNTHPSSEDEEEQHIPHHDKQQIESILKLQNNLQDYLPEWKNQKIKQQSSAPNPLNKREKPWSREQPRRQLSPPESDHEDTDQAIKLQNIIEQNERPIKKARKGQSIPKRQDIPPTFCRESSQLNQLDPKFALFHPNQQYCRLYTALDSAKKEIRVNRPTIPLRKESYQLTDKQKRLLRYLINKDTLLKQIIENMKEKGRCLVPQKMLICVMEFTLQQLISAVFRERLLQPLSYLCNLKLMQIILEKNLIGLQKLSKSRIFWQANSFIRCFENCSNNKNMMHTFNEYLYLKIKYEEWRRVYEYESNVKGVKESIRNLTIHRFKYQHSSNLKRPLHHLTF